MNSQPYPIAMQGHTAVVTGDASGIEFSFRNRLAEASAYLASEIEMMKPPRKQ